MQPKVSIIVPVYNAGIYLTQCLDSLTNQTLQEIEIILVLDCPTDGSDKIACEYAKKDLRIKIVENKENLHIGFSRNEGLKIATGEYIGFCDHDDFCELNMFNELYSKAKENDFDIVISDFCEHFNGNISYFRFPDNDNDNIFKETIFEYLLNGRISTCQEKSFSNIGAIWNQIFKRDMLLKNKIYFDDNRIITMEDTVFNLRAHFFANKVTSIPKVFYHHQTNSSNAYSDYAYVSFGKVVPYIEIRYEFLKNHSLLEKYKEANAEFALRKLYSSFRNEVRNKGLMKSLYVFSKIRSNKILQELLNSNTDFLKIFPPTKIIFYWLCSTKKR
ncbi:MAG: glycosyltransferase [Paludibacter sp.]|nr:glycosyltransferase [Paludibacter sp.]